ncbi:hypothetical protein KY348_04585 [Candidatus Woesearchaeota archaeon]|nr:hypothetical protein [Candidatus Woesearchaeota archaeon]
MKNCPMWISWIVLIIGILYLISDILTWGPFWWDLNWWTAVFLILGLAGISKKRK